MNVDFLNDIEPIPGILSDRCGADTAVAKLLVIHGEQDMTVPVREAKKLAAVMR